MELILDLLFFFSSRRRHTRLTCDWSSDVCSSDLWNMMMSMSGAWFFVVASEAITVGDKTITLPGIGAYVAMAIDQKSLSAVGWAILAMGIVILIYDQCMFRPLVA